MALAKAMAAWAMVCSFWRAQGRQRVARRRAAPRRCPRRCRGRRSPRRPSKKDASPSTRSSGRPASAPSPARRSAGWLRHGVFSVQCFRSRDRLAGGARAAVPDRAEPRDSGGHRGDGLASSMRAREPVARRLGEDRAADGEALDQSERGGEPEARRRARPPARRGRAARCRGSSGSCASIAAMAAQAARRVCGSSFHQSGLTPSGVEAGAMTRGGRAVVDARRSCDAMISSSNSRPVARAASHSAPQLALLLGASSRGGSSGW